MTEAILIVDPQYDFFPGGALGVTDGDKIIDPINALVNSKEVPVYISQDWHPEKTVHFESSGGIWPDHCVQHTKGSQIHEGLKVEPVAIVRKGTDPTNDAGYSSFEGLGPEGISLQELLFNNGIDRLIVCGLATDYCVKATVLDALSKGYGVQIFTDGMRPVNIKPEDGIAAVADMMEAGATILTLEDINE